MRETLKLSYHERREAEIVLNHCLADPETIARRYVVLLHAAEILATLRIRFTLEKREHPTLTFPGAASLPDMEKILERANLPLWREEMQP